ncbi:MAG TPA: hypothetical protein VF937_11875 [Chloroflexota bacterium]
MPASPRVIQAVQTAIVASAHASAYEHVAAAALACKRLGSLTSGRWRSAGRDLATLEDDLQKAFADAAEALSAGAEAVSVPPETLWTIGDAANTLDLLRDSALDELDEDDARAAAVLKGQVLFAASFVEDPELPDRGTTLLFGWPDPLSPATWPWQANWVFGDGQDISEDEGEDAEELDVFEVGEMEGDEALLADLADELGCSRQDARGALRSAAMALTRASLLAAASDAGDEEDGEQDDTDNHNAG